MPTYEYACEKCGHQFEIRQGFHEEPISTCPKCGGAVRRIFHPAGVIFKGSGFYLTDNRKAEKPAESGTEAKSETPEKSEKKEAPKPAPAKTKDE